MSNNSLNLHRSRGSNLRIAHSKSCNDDILRCASVGSTNQRFFYRNPRFSSSSLDDLKRDDLARNINLKKFFKKSSWISDDSSDNEERELNRSLSGSGNGSSSSLKTVSPLMSRADMDKCDFIIPISSSKLSNYTIHHKEPANLGALDITQYLSQEEAQELQEIGIQVKLGEAKFCLAYSEAEQKLKIILKSVEIYLKPSCTVVGSYWSCDTLTCFDFIQDKKKAVDLKFGQETLVDLKKVDIAGKTLRLTIYDIRRRNKNLAIGHVVLALRDLVDLSSKFGMHSKKIGFYSQPAGFNKGKISLTVCWLSSAEKVEINVGEVSNLKNPYHSEGKEYYVKVTTYIGGVKYKCFKTSLLKTSPSLKFQEKFNVPLTNTQIKDSSFVFCLFMKHTSKKMIASKILAGKTVIGPYMKHNERSLSQWENMIKDPMEEISSNHILYL